MMKSVALWGAVLMTGVAKTDGLCSENRHLSACFDGGSGSIRQVVNKLTGETISIEERGFRVDAVEFSATAGNARLQSLRRVSPEKVVAVHALAHAVVTSTYTLGRDHHFLKKTLAIRPGAAFGWKSATVSVLDLRKAALDLVRYPHPKMVTWFGRSARGGIFIGLEKPFDSATLDKGVPTLSYFASLKMRPDVEIRTEAVYLGAYKRIRGDEARPGFPLQSESYAMVAMTGALLGPPRHGFVPMACGW